MMAHITTCSKCGKLYEESSEETANAPYRTCTSCYRLLLASQEWVRSVSKTRKATLLTDTPGYKAWVSGKATRGDVQHLNRMAGLPCYCASLWQGHCDFCTGMVGPGDHRFEAQMREQAEHPEEVAHE